MKVIKTMNLEYHKLQLRKLMTKYKSRLSEQPCGKKLIKHISSWVIESENEMDAHIKAINKLDNKKFQLFSEGYVPSGVMN